MDDLGKSLKIGKTILVGTRRILYLQMIGNNIVLQALCHLMVTRNCLFISISHFVSACAPSANIQECSVRAKAYKKATWQR